MIELAPVLVGLVLLATAVWVWRWNPKPGSGLAWFPAVRIPGYSKLLAASLAIAGVAWLVYVARDML